MPVDDDGGTARLVAVGMALQAKSVESALLDVEQETLDGGSRPLPSIGSPTPAGTGTTDCHPPWCARFECDLRADLEIGDHTVVLGSVVGTAADTSKTPLIHHDRRFHHLPNR